MDSPTFSPKRASGDRTFDLLIVAVEASLNAGWEERPSMHSFSTAFGNEINFFNFIKMAKNNDNLFVRGARGHVGKQIVYRKHGKGTVMAKMPSINENLEPMEEQVQVRNLFREAVIYAKGAIADPELKTCKSMGAPAGICKGRAGFRSGCNPEAVRSVRLPRPW